MASDIKARKKKYWGAKNKTLRIMFGPNWRAESNRRL
jgi:hypothetical protein